MFFKHSRQQRLTRFVGSPYLFAGETKTEHACPTPQTKENKKKCENESKHEVDFEMEGPRSQPRWGGKEGCCKRDCFVSRMKLLRAERMGILSH
ncbi:hypothetical protein TNIN_395571 [Trichonephila inaurata madagascariensis]|uniref:Uncharacterized protein n=1 Tax=Trichonephila inaurata madagascariensis TaxID=2747483 RepID=A0A8X6YFA0_9ARAC|nr:hypothetical protein TNIN_395571 [Trichonephila inaurata madagascariensis]